MSFSVGVVGFPNAGKSTLFKALTKQEVRIEPRPFTTIHPNVGVVSVSDERLDRIAEVIQPEKKTPTTIEFWDIAGLIKEAHQGEGLGNQFLAQIRNCHALLEVVRTFKNEGVSHVEGGVDPDRDLEIIKTELLMKDLETVENALSKLENNKEKEVEKKKEVLRKIKRVLEQGKRASEAGISEEEENMIREFQLLTQKPLLYILNKGEENKVPQTDLSPCLKVNLQTEMEMTELSKKDRRELGLKSVLPELISACYEALDLITFYTVAGGKEVRAWTLKRGGTAPRAGGVVHSDFEEKFIRAEVINWNKLVNLGGWKQAKDKGEVSTVGKDYVVKDGDVIEFKI